MIRPGPDQFARKLPRDASEEHLRKQAKQLIRAHARKLATAEARVRRVFADKKIGLAEAQHVVAAEYGFPSWPKLIGHVLSVRDMVTDKRDDSLVRAAVAHDFDGVRRRVESGDFVQHDLDFALARLHGDPGRMGEYLIQLGADPDGEYGLNYGPIILAHCEGLNVEGIRFLLEHGADPNTETKRQASHPITPMRMALSSYEREAAAARSAAIDVLLAHGAEVPPEVDPVAMAIFRGDAFALAELIQREPWLLSRRFERFDYGNLALHGATFLHMAADFAELDCVRALLAAGADPNAQAARWNGWGGHTALFHAVVGNPPEATEALVGRTDPSILGSFRRYTWPAGEERWYREVSARCLCETNQRDDRGRPKPQNAAALALLIRHGAPEPSAGERARAATLA